MTNGDGFLKLGIALACLLSVLAAPVRAQVCANDPSRTLFVGGPSTDACSLSNDETTCNRSFHRSGAGHLAPCVWSGDTCDGNTVGEDPTVDRSCETLPDPQTCIDPTRTVQLAGGTAGFNSGTSVCEALSDQESCEEAWHTTTKGVGISCCWQTTGSCVGSVWGFSNGDCTVGNTCFASTAGASNAPTMGTWAMLMVGLALLGLGGTKLRPRALA